MFAGAGMTENQEQHQHHISSNYSAWSVIIYPSRNIQNLRDISGDVIVFCANKESRSNPTISKNVSHAIAMPAGSRDMLCYLIARNLYNFSHSPPALHLLFGCYATASALVFVAPSFSLIYIYKSNVQKESRGSRMMIILMVHLLLLVFKFNFNWGMEWKL